MHKRHSKLKYFNT